jgi:hypothetical protein
MPRTAGCAAHGSVVFSPGLRAMITARWQHCSRRVGRGLRCGILGCAIVWQAAAQSGSAYADDTRPYLLSEPIEYTDVIDAFDDEDPIDVNVALSFTRSEQNSSIARESANPGDQVAGRTLRVAESRHITNALALEIDVGLYKDLMVYGRLPLVLSDTRRLSLPDSARCAAASCVDARNKISSALTPATTAGDSMGDGALFDLGTGSGYHSATRSGIPAVDLGVAWGVVNQYRTPWLPTWVLSLEARLGVGKLMTPCSDAATCDTGINRGTARFELASRWSYRLRFIEPYLGLSYAFERATGASDRFSPGGDQAGYLDTTPPSMFESTLGAAIIAWEDRGRFQRFAIDVRGRAAYVTSGRDYSPLFDALGTSQNAYLKSPYSSPSGAAVSFNGLSNVDSYARLGLELAAAMQAARYVRFRLGVAFWHETSHWLTDAAPCASGAASSCASNQINALYRPVIDLPGQRFLLNSDLSFDLFAHATGQF